MHTYTCAQCIHSTEARHTLTRADYGRLSNLVRTLNAHKDAWPFLRPVDVQDVPTYTQVIKHPMGMCYSIYIQYTMCIMQTWAPSERVYNHIITVHWPTS